MEVAWHRDGSASILFVASWHASMVRSSTRNDLSASHVALWKFAGRLRSTGTFGSSAGGAGSPRGGLLFPLDHPGGCLLRCEGVAAPLGVETLATSHVGT